jgi:hypothetical protein
MEMEGDQGGISHAANVEARWLQVEIRRTRHARARSIEHRPEEVLYRISPISAHWAVNQREKDTGVICKTAAK